MAHASVEHLRLLGGSSCVNIHSWGTDSVHTDISQSKRDAAGWKQTGITQTQDCLYSLQAKKNKGKKMF